MKMAGVFGPAINSSGGLHTRSSKQEKSTVRVSVRLALSPGSAVVH